MHVTNHEKFKVFVSTCHLYCKNMKIHFNLIPLTMLLVMLKELNLFCLVSSSILF